MNSAPSSSLFQTGQSAVVLLGLIVTAALVARRITGALLIGILTTAIFAWSFGIAELPEGVAAFPAFPTGLFGQAFTGLGILSQIGFLEAASIVFVLLFVDLFDTIGTLSGLGAKSGYIRAAT